LIVVGEELVKQLFLVLALSALLVSEYEERERKA
jgi:hypothetical protein